MYQQLLAMHMSVIGHTAVAALQAAGRAEHAYALSAWWQHCRLQVCEQQP